MRPTTFIASLSLILSSSSWAFDYGEQIKGLSCDQDKTCIYKRPTHDGQTGDKGVEFPSGFIGDCARFISSFDKPAAAESSHEIKQPEQQQKDTSDNSDDSNLVISVKYKKRDEPEFVLSRELGHGYGRAGMFLTLTGTMMGGDAGETQILIVPKVLAVYTAFHGYDKRTA
ncbi:hypothetical protein Ga0074115_1181 [endosymbiont of Ridgeia piscesae]|jgi:hypothetical protein|uniref:Uncharacterized protein n=1 Tax=endosymbiont of Ridgeia piscesae TaxID=54398 RepID=A0A0T5YY12_9GAMM|nr:hypothetical protein [endosymbiont of Ridgeia piscesae]KRT55409.1 hypothetical protein Ga0074115_1181 [endosymbiont of Ridgeia piscesae]